jgi:hypothetical protein
MNMINNFLVFISLFLFGCSSNDKDKAGSQDGMKAYSSHSKEIAKASVDTVINNIPDSIFLQIHQIVDDTPEYQSLKAQYKNKLQLMIFPNEIYPNYEINIGQVIAERFLTSIRWNINLSSKEITIRDPHLDYKEITLAEFRKRWKKYAYKSYLMPF